MTMHYYISHLSPGSVLCKPFPPICNIPNNMHNRPQLVPHRLLHWHFGLIMFIRCPILSRLLRVHRCGDKRRRIRHIRIYHSLLILQLVLRMFARGGGQSDLSKGGDKIGGFLFDSFAAMFFWGPSERGVRSEETSFWFLEVATRGGDEG